MTTCLTPVELLVSRFFGEECVTALHARACPGCSARLTALDHRLEGVAPGRDAHPSDIEFAELLDARSDDEVDLKVLEHVETCFECQRELVALMQLVGDPSVSSELERPQWTARDQVAANLRRRRTGVALATLAAAAALVFAIQTLTPRGRTVDGTLRHATIDAAAAPQLVAPVGPVKRLDTLTWTSVPRADRYRVTVFDASGEIAWETEIPDTVASVPPSVATRWSGSYRWRVKARTTFDRWVDSKFGSFSVGGELR